MQGNTCFAFIITTVNKLARYTRKGNSPMYNANHVYLNYY